MAQLERLYQLYNAYEEKAKEVRRKASRYAGAFGLGDDPRKHECHEDFFDDVGRWVQDFLNENPSAGEITQAACWILKAADAHRDTDVYWLMYAAQSHAGSLIPHMSREESLQLLQWYDGAYPKGERLPAQQEVYRILRKQSGLPEDPGRRGFRSLFKRM